MPCRPPLIRDYNFRTGWTTITNVDLNGDGDDELLYYNATTGLARFVNPNNTGAGTLIRDYNFRTGWTTITNVDANGNGHDELLYYNATTGVTRSINPNNTGAGSVIADYNFRTGWTSITNVNLDGSHHDREDDILYYDTITGLARFTNPSNTGAG